MRKFLLLCGAVLCLSMTVAAQDFSAEVDATDPATAPADPVSFHPLDRASWDIGGGYQFQHYKAFGQTFHDNGLNVSITRYLNDWLGVEGTAAMGFGNLSITANAAAKSFFIGGGPHFAAHNHTRFEPWGHALVGLQHFRFEQVSQTMGTNSSFGFMGGGGVDFEIRPQIYWRVQADYIGTHFQSAMQTNYSFGTGILVTF